MSDEGSVDSQPGDRLKRRGWRTFVVEPAKYKGANYDHVELIGQCVRPLGLGSSRSAAAFEVPLRGLSSVVGFPDRNRCRTRQRC